MPRPIVKRTTNTAEKPNRVSTCKNLFMFQISQLSLKAKPYSLTLPLIYISPTNHRVPIYHPLRCLLLPSTFPLPSDFANRLQESALPCDKLDDQSLKIMTSSKIALNPAYL